MRYRNTYLFTVFILGFFALNGCAIGKKEWPSAKQHNEAFRLHLLSAEVMNGCLLLKIGTEGAIHHLYRASIQYESVGGPDGGCEGCPFVPREAQHITRDQDGFDLSNNTLSLSLCGLDTTRQYRFRVAGKSDLPTQPIVYTDVYMTTQ